MQFGICNEIFRDWKIDDVFAYCAKLGYHAVEIAPFTLADSVTDITKAERERIRASAEKHGIQIAGLHWLLVKPEGLYINHPDAGMRSKTARYFCDLVQFCADLGGKIMVAGSPRQRNIMPGVSPEQAREWALETFREAVALAQTHGITICFEPLAASETNFMNTAANAITFVRRLNSTAFKIILDVKAMCSEAKPVPQIIRESWPHFAHFHANDKNLKGPGFGEVDFKPIVRALKEVGYNGLVSVEVFDFAEGPEMIASKSLEYLREVFENS